MTRRKFIRIVGSSFVVLAAGAGGWTFTRTPHRAMEPWSLAGGEAYGDVRLRALSYAILAPNPHNRQPWLVELVGQDTIVLYCDTARLLPETDPFNRQITIGHGCFLELLDLAAREAGYGTDITLFPEGSSDTQLDQRPIARIRLDKNVGASKDPLFAQILLRRSNKESYDTNRPVSESDAQSILQAARPGAIVGQTVDAARVASLRDLTLRAVRVEWNTPRTNKESVDLIRIGKREIEANPDGIDLGGAFMEGLKLAGQLERDQMLDQTSSTFKNSLEAYEESFHTSMGFLWQGSANNTRADQIEAGRTWVRMNLRATQLGLGVQPVSQALQEYPEMKPLYDEVHQSLGFAVGQTVQMLARVGYGPQVPPSPRWKIEQKIRTS